jgi:anti-sigma factor RsiW
VSSLSGNHIDDVDVAGYALGALDPAEQQVIEHHIRTCQACAERVARDVRTVGMLPFAIAAHVKPAPDVKASLFARIAHSQQAAADAALPTRQPRATIPSTLTIPSSQATLVGASAEPGHASRTVFRSSWLTAVIAAPLLLALVLIGAWSMQLRSQLTAQQSTLSSQASELSTLKASLANFGAGDVQEYQLQPQAGAPQAEGQLLLSSDHRDAIVRVDLNTQQASGGSARILINNNGTIEPLGEVTLDARGRGQTNVTFDEPLAQGQSIQIQAVPADDAMTTPTELLLSGTVNGMSDPGFGANYAP